MNEITMEEEVVTGDEVDAAAEVADEEEVPDLLFSEDATLLSDADEILSPEEFANDGQDDFISQLASDEDFWFDDDEFALDDLDLDMDMGMDMEMDSMIDGFFDGDN